MGVELFMVYVVRPGDTLYFIARRYGLTVEEVMRANGLESDLILVGQTLYLPILPTGIYGMGSRGDAVRMLQQALRSMGFTLQVDGIYGPETANTIYYIQLKYPELAADGIYGPQTRGFLRQMLHSGYHLAPDPYSTLALVNKTNALDPYYLPPDLTIPEVPFTTEGSAPRKQMRAEAAQALEQLFARAAAEGIELAGVSAYRSYPRQATIFRENWEQDPEEANRSSARPGESEHQTGLAIDVSSPSVNYVLTQAFGETEEGRWLAQNAADFGFILRYPQGKEDITGYLYEPWHIRYVGRPAAEAIAQSGLTLEEFLAEGSAVL
jgi:LAS superfamily LD-carboxypeptidase LdcB/LysM repeat protein